MKYVFYSLAGLAVLGAILYILQRRNQPQLVVKSRTATGLPVVTATGVPVVTDTGIPIVTGTVTTTTTDVPPVTTNPVGTAIQNNIQPDKSVTQGDLQPPTETPGKTVITTTPGKTVITTTPGKTTVTTTPGKAVVTDPLQFL